MWVTSCFLFNVKCAFNNKKSSRELRDIEIEASFSAAASASCTGQIKYTTHLLGLGVSDIENATLFIRKLQLVASVKLQLC